MTFILEVSRGPILWNSDKRTGHEWILGFPANFSLQRSWLTFTLSIRFLLNVRVWSKGSCTASEHGHTTQWPKYFALHKQNPCMIILTIYGWVLKTRMKVLRHRLAPLFKTSYLPQVTWKRVQNLWNVRRRIYVRKTGNSLNSNRFSMKDITYAVWQSIWLRMEYCFNQ